MSCSADTASQRKKENINLMLPLSMQITKNTHNFENYPSQQLHQLSIDLRSTITASRPSRTLRHPLILYTRHFHVCYLFIPPLPYLLFYFLLFLSKLLHLPPCSNDSGQVMNTTVLPAGIKN